VRVAKLAILLVYEMKFNQGDQVVFLNEIGGGIVRGYDENGLVLVEDADGFELPFPESELIPKMKWDESGIPEPQERRQEKTEREENFGYRLKKGRQPYMEVDLHIHMIADSTRNLSNHDMVKQQLAHFEKTLAEAKRLRLTKVVFIHGIGKGRLRDEIRKRLRATRNCEFEDADYRVYGIGATQVKLWYN